MPLDAYAQCVYQAELLRGFDPQHELLGFVDSLQDSNTIQVFLKRFVPEDFHPCPHSISAGYQKMQIAFDSYLLALRQAVNDAVQTT